LRDPATIARLTRAVAAPVNINVRAGSPTIADLERLGVARASTASQVSLLAYAATRKAAQSIIETGGFEGLGPALSQADMQKLFLG